MSDEQEDRLTILPLILTWVIIITVLSGILTLTCRQSIFLLDAGFFDFISLFTLILAIKIMILGRAN